MRRRLIGLFFLFSAGLFLIISLINFKFVSNAAPIYILTLFFATIITCFPSLLSLKIIIDNYDKHNWNTNTINIVASSFLGLLYSLILTLIIYSALNIPLLLGFLMVIFGIVSGSLLGWFASTITFVSLGISVFLGAMFSYLFSQATTPVLLTIRTSFILNLLIISGVLGFYAFFGKNNLKRKDSLIKEQSDNSDNLSLFDLLELAKNKQKPLSKAEIMSELKLDIKTVDNLLKDAEINQLCHVQLDGDNGTIKYKFDV